MATALKASGTSSPPAPHPVAPEAVGSSLPLGMVRTNSMKLILPPLGHAALSSPLSASSTVLGQRVSPHAPLTPGLPNGTHPLLSPAASASTPSAASSAALAQQAPSDAPLTLGLSNGTPPLQDSRGSIVVLVVDSVHPSDASAASSSAAAPPPGVLATPTLPPLVSSDPPSLALPTAPPAASTRSTTTTPRGSTLTALAAGEKRPSLLSPAKDQVAPSDRPPSPNGGRQSPNGLLVNSTKGTSWAAFQFPPSGSAPAAASPTFQGASTTQAPSSSSSLPDSPPMQRSPTNSSSSSFASLYRDRVQRHADALLEDKSRCWKAIGRIELAGWGLFRTVVHAVSIPITLTNSLFFGLVSAPVALIGCCSERARHKAKGLFTIAQKNLYFTGIAAESIAENIFSGAMVCFCRKNAQRQALKKKINLSTNIKEKGNLEKEEREIPLNCRDRMEDKIRRWHINIERSCGACCRRTPREEGASQTYNWWIHSLYMRTMKWMAGTTRFFSDSSHNATHRRAGSTMPGKLQKIEKTPL